MNERGPRHEPKQESFLHIERKSPEILEALEKAPQYKKNALVPARRARAGETVLTITATGDTETENIAKDGDWVVTNASGEEYILPPDIFSNRYEDSDTPGVYRAVGYCKAIQNPYEKPIEIFASWGTPQRGDADCFIADTCGADGNLLGEPYLIEHAAFQTTYSASDAT